MPCGPLELRSREVPYPWRLLFKITEQLADSGKLSSFATNMSFPVALSENNLEDDNIQN